MPDAVEAHIGSAVAVVAAIFPGAGGVETFIGRAGAFRLLLRTDDRSTLYPSIITAGPSQESQRLEAGDAVAADHQVVMHGDPQGAAGLDDLPRHVDIGLRRRRIA
jgi:hypothetical protein